MNSYVPLPPQYHTLVASSPGSILLQTSHIDAENYRSYLFLNPQQILSATDTLFEEIEKATTNGAWVAGFLSYEYGTHLQNPIHPTPDQSKTPPAWFGVYPEAFVFNHKTGQFEGNPPPDSRLTNLQLDQTFEIHNLQLNISKQSYAQKISAIQDYIRAGDTYQVNFTDQFQFDFSGSPQTLFTALTENQPVQYSAFLHTDNWDILSFSPELFFRLKDQQIITRPMKGTAPRGADLAEDHTIAQWLHNDLKNRSENVMIVDLMRNDLGRICNFGSVQVNHLFSIEKYETLFQMTSEISGTLRIGTSYSEIFKSLFPCGSVTGAPKHRTMQIIHELEQQPRGIYTGAMGFISPNSEAVFNVPIRTLVLEKDRGVMGIGSGIVSDSNAEDEYRECLLKSQFLTRREEPYHLLESILWSNGYHRLSMHLERMELSAKYFGFTFRRPDILAVLNNAESHLTANIRTKVRLTLDRVGQVQITHSPAADNTPGNVTLSPIRTSSNDRFLRHKTTRRKLYEEQYALAQRNGFVDVLFLNERDELTEGAISNVFIEKDGNWFTPPIVSGLLPGIYRRHLLETRPGTQERVLTLADLASADAVYICNAIRGCTRVNVIQR